MRQVIEVEICRIDLNPHQPRKYFDEVELQGLADSIRSVGLIHPPIVRPFAGGNRYQLISGERRLRAAGKAGLDRIPVLIDPGSQQKSAEAALVENVQRVDLSPIEIADALQRLSEDFELGQEELAQKVGKKRSTVANYLRLLQLPEEIQDSLSQGLITISHAKMLLSLPGKQQRELHRKLLRRPMSVRQVERLVQKKVEQPEVVKRLEEKLGARVTLQRGKIVIHTREPERLLERLL